MGLRNRIAPKKIQKIVSTAAASKKTESSKRLRNRIAPKKIQRIASTAAASKKTESSKIPRNRTAPKKIQKIASTAAASLPRLNSFDNSCFWKCACTAPGFLYQSAVLNIAQQQR